MNISSNDTPFVIQPPEERPPFAWRGRDVLIITVGILLILLVGSIGLVRGLRVSPGDLQQTGNPGLLVSLGMALLEAVAIIAGVYLLGLKRLKQGWQAVGLRGLTTPWLWGAVALSVLVVPLSGAAAAAIQAALGLPFNNPQLPFLVPAGFNWVGFIGMTLLGGLVVPFAEELFFRGVLFGWLRSRWSFWPSALLSGLVFGALHGDIAVGGAAALLGVLLAWVYERSGSLWPGVLVHAINNSFKIVLLYALLASGVKL